MKYLIFISPQEEKQITNHKSEGHPEENTKDNIHEQEESVVSYELIPEASKGNQTMAGRYYTCHDFLTVASSEPLEILAREPLKYFEYRLINLFAFLPSGRMHLDKGGKGDPCLTRQIHTEAVLAWDQFVHFLFCFCF